MTYLLLIIGVFLIILAIVLLLFAFIGLCDYLSILSLCKNAIRVNKMARRLNADILMSTGEVDKDVLNHAYTEIIVANESLREVKKLDIDLFFHKKVQRKLEQLEPIDCDYLVKNL